MRGPMTTQNQEADLQLPAFRSLRRCPDVSTVSESRWRCCEHVQDLVSVGPRLQITLAML